MLLRQTIYTSIMLSLICANVSFAVGFTETYYVPIPEEQVYENLKALNPITDPSDPNFEESSVTSTTIESVLSIAVSIDGTVIYFDHYEDGYEVDILIPTQSSSQIYGDGIEANGDACSFIGIGSVNDTISASDVLVFLNQVETDPLANTEPYLLTGQDKFTSTQPLTVSRIAWATSPGTVLAGAVEVFPTRNWGHAFEAPISEDDTEMDSDGMFAQVAASVMAMEDNTVITIDGNPFVTLNEGESELTPLSSVVKLGSTLVATKPIQLHGNLAGLL